MMQSWNSYQMMLLVYRRKFKTANQMVLYDMEAGTLARIGYAVCVGQASQ